MDGGPMVPGRQSASGCTCIDSARTSRIGSPKFPPKSSQGPDSKLGDPPRGFSACVDTCRANDSTRNSRARMEAVRALRAFLRAIGCRKRRCARLLHPVGALGLGPQRLGGHHQKVCYGGVVLNCVTSKASVSEERSTISFGIAATRTSLDTITLRVRRGLVRVIQSLRLLPVSR